MTRSEAEEVFLALCGRFRLAAPEVNARLEGHEVDFLWRNHRLVAEIDGYAAHGTRSAFHRDRRRDSDLLLAGYRVVRFTWSQLESDSGWVAETVLRPSLIGAWLLMHAVVRIRQTPGGNALPAALRRPQRPPHAVHGDDAAQHAVAVHGHDRAQAAQALTA